MSSRFDFEQLLLECWHVTNDVEHVYDFVMESDDLDQDKIANLLLGISSIYELKFQKLFDMFDINKGWPSGQP